MNACLADLRAFMIKFVLYQSAPRSIVSDRRIIGVDRDQEVRQLAEPSDDLLLLPGLLPFATAEGRDFRLADNGAHLLGIRNSRPQHADGGEPQMGVIRIGESAIGIDECRPRPALQIGIGPDWRFGQRALRTEKIGRWLWPATAKVSMVEKAHGQRRKLENIESLEETRMSKNVALGMINDAMSKLRDAQSEAEGCKFGLDHNDVDGARSHIKRVIDDVNTSLRNLNNARMQIMSSPN
jgi:hypothetical protein